MVPQKRFPLELADGFQARSLEELKEHFDLESVLRHYKSGKLLTWLEDRYLEGEAEAVRALDEFSDDFQRQLCGVFQVEYAGDDADAEAFQLRRERLAKLRTITDEPEFIDHIDQVAFDQEDLADRLDEDWGMIYLCGEKFTIPASCRGVHYIGIGNPTVHISGRLPQKAEDFGIDLTSVKCDNLPWISHDFDGEKRNARPSTCRTAGFAEEKSAAAFPKRGLIEPLSREKAEKLLIKEIIRINYPDDINAGGIKSVRVPTCTKDGSTWQLIDKSRLTWTFRSPQHPALPPIEISIMDVQCYDDYIEDDEE